MQSNDDYIILLLNKRFTGEITPDESAVIKEWLDRSPENERLAAQFQQVWESAGYYEKTFSPDLDAAFRQLPARIRQAEKPQVKVVAQHETGWFPACLTWSCSIGTITAATPQPQPPLPPHDHH